MQLYIEKWLQIVFRVTRIAPPIPGNILVHKLDEMFQELQEPFNTFRAERRKNFLNYNYVFCRLFQRVHCTQFCMFFPLIKSKQKLQQLDDMWTQMAGALNWEIKPLEQVAPFAVRLERPDLLLQRLASEYVPQVPAALQIAPSKMVFRTLGRYSAEKLLRSTAQPRLDPPEQEPQKAAAAKKRHRSSAARGPQLLNRRRCLGRRV